MSNVNIIKKMHDEMFGLRNEALKKYQESEEKEDGIRYNYLEKIAEGLWTALIYLEELEKENEA